MGLDSSFADIQLPGNELVALAFGKEREDFEFPVREFFFTDSAGQLRGDLGRDKHLAATDARVLGSVPRILLGGWIAVFAGEILNNYVLAKIKIVSNGRYLWIRTIGSTIIGQFANTVLFYMIGLYMIGLYGVLPTQLLIQSIVTGWLLKVAVEVVFTPVTYWVVGNLKRIEQED